MSDPIERRAFLLGVGLATAGLATAADPRKGGVTETASLENAFKAWVSTLNEGKSEAFLHLHHEHAVFVDEDSPFRMSRDEFVDHLGFHGKNIWEGFAWVPRSSSYRVFSDTGVVADNHVFGGTAEFAAFAFPKRTRCGNIEDFKTIDIR